MSEIPPPLVPRPSGQGDGLMLPWRLADAPRLQLEFLSRSSSLDDDVRAAISKWLAGYNAYVMTWLEKTYGKQAVEAADVISRYTAQRMNENRSAAMKDAERELFNRLEEDFRNE